MPKSLASWNVGGCTLVDSSDALVRAVECALAELPLAISTAAVETVATLATTRARRDRRAERRMASLIPTLPLLLD
jgi:hypothetical protein